MTQHAITPISHTSATRLTPLGSHSGMDITIQNINSTGYLYIGGEGVTEATYGYRISPNNAISFELPGNDSLYAIASASGMVAAIMQIGLEGNI